MAQGGSSKSQIGFDKIKMGKQLGAGGFGTVYEASLKAAVKHIHNPDKRTYNREITQLLKLQHENIVKIYGVSQNGDEIYLVMELAENGSLNDALYKSSTPPAFYQAWDWGCQCANGVAYLHNQKIIHRDLKPHNCLLFNNKKLLKICDFGLARDVTDEIMTQGVGTPIYMAPEVIEGGHYTEKCDVYSWGLMYWEMFAHKRPFAGKDRPSIYGAKKRGETPPLFVEGDGSGLNVSQINNTNALLKRCWNKDPLQRPKMREVQINLLILFLDSNARN